MCNTTTTCLFLFVFSFFLKHEHHTEKRILSGGASPLAGWLISANPVFFGAADCFRLFSIYHGMELAEIGRCRASVSPPQTHQGGQLGSIAKAAAVCWGCPRCSNARAAGSAGAENGVWWRNARFFLRAPRGFNWRALGCSARIIFRRVNDEQNREFPLCRRWETSIIQQAPGAAPGACCIGTEWASGYLIAQQSGNF